MEKLYSSFYTVVVACLALIITSCGGGDSETIIENFGIAYVKRPLIIPDQTDVREPFAFNEGGDLFFRDLASPSATEKNVTTSITGGLGDVKDIESSYDGSKILFAMHAPLIAGADPEDQPKWNIWVYTTSTGTLTRVITSDITAEAGHDIAPHYLPDGRIVFSSTRQRQSKATLLDEGKPQYAALDENRNEEAVLLHVMNADGSDIRQLSYNQSHDLDPSVLQSGEIIFTRWDNMGSRNQMSLYKMRPDGTELHVVYGTHSNATGTGNTTAQFLQARERQDGKIMSIIRPNTGTEQGGEIILIDIANYADNNQPSWPNQGVLTGNGQTAATINSVVTTSGPSAGGRFSAAYPLWDGTNRMLVSWTSCRLLENTIIVPCTAARLADPAAVEADTLYGIYIYNMDNNTQLPVLVASEGFMLSDVVAVQSRQLPNILLDKVSGVDLDSNYVNEDVGVLNIRSVYDVDGSFNDLGSSATTTAELADPAQFTAIQRPARFLRIIKAVSMPDDDIRDIPNTAFGRSTQQLMREVIGYAPIEPDGSVKVKVPANVPLAISVLDENGRRISTRHQNWIQVRPGEIVSCNGCHSHNTDLPHGHVAQATSVNLGAPTTGIPFPNTEAALITNISESMAETRTRLDATALDLSVDIIYSDVWTDVVAANRAKDLAFSYLSTNLTTAAPSTSQCQTTWSANCRIVINYEQHIHPLWTKVRGVDTCSACHGTVDAMSNLQVPAAQLDLSNGVSTDEADHFKSYRELFFSDNEQEIVMGALIDRLVQATDGNGDPLFQLDANGSQILDGMGNPIPILVTVNVSPSMSTSGALSSSDFFSLFKAGGTHVGRMDTVELKLVSEWVDIGAQYYNNPFDVPPP